VLLGARGRAINPANPKIEEVDPTFFDRLSYEGFGRILRFNARETYHLVPAHWYEVCVVSPKWRVTRHDERLGDTFDSFMRLLGVTNRGDTAQAGHHQEFSQFLHGVT
jgi:hypothetical protein